MKKPLKRVKPKKSIYQKILEAADCANRLILSASDVKALASDDAIITRALNDYEEDETGIPGDVRGI